MSNFDTVKLVRSVVAERDLVAVLTHFHIYDGRIQGTNGKLTLDAEWKDWDGEPVNVPAEPFVKAFEAMAEPKIELKENFLVIREKRMRIRIPLSVDHFPLCKRPASDWHPMDDSLLIALRKIRPFISEDASRPWACGALYRDGHLYATNNIVMVRIQWAYDGPEFSLPGFAIDQLGRCNLPVRGIHVNDNAVAFDLGDTWMETARYAEQWPDVEAMFKGINFESLPSMRGNEYAIVEKLLPFVPDKRHPVIRFTGDRVATLEGDMQAEIETSCGTGAFHAVPLQSVLKIATHWDPSQYPNPVPFTDVNDSLDGIIAGVRI